MGCLVAWASVLGCSHGGDVRAYLLPPVWGSRGQGRREGVREGDRLWRRGAGGARGAGAGGCGGEGTTTLLTAPCCGSATGKLGRAIGMGIGWVFDTEM